MSDKRSFESRILDFWTNADYSKVEIVHGLIKEIFKRRRAQQAEEEARIGKIADNPAPKVRRKRRTKAQMAAAQASSNASSHGADVIVPNVGAA